MKLFLIKESLEQRGRLNGIKFNKKLFKHYIVLLSFFNNRKGK